MSRGVRLRLLSGSSAWSKRRIECLPSLSATRPHLLKRSKPTRLNLLATGRICVSCPATFPRSATSGRKRVPRERTGLRRFHTNGNARAGGRQSLWATSRPGQNGPEKPVARIRGLRPTSSFLFSPPRFPLPGGPSAPRLQRHQMAPPATYRRRAPSRTGRLPSGSGRRCWSPSSGQDGHRTPPGCSGRRAHRLGGSHSSAVPRAVRDSHILRKRGTDGPIWTAAWGPSLSAIGRVPCPSRVFEPSHYVPRPPPYGPRPQVDARRE